MSKQAAIEALADHFSASWEKGEGPPDAYLRLAGKRIAVDIAALKPRKLQRNSVARPRLRFDKVVRWLVSTLQATLHDAVPDGRTLVVTVTAPIRLPGRTAATLEERIRSALTRRSARLELDDTIHGNRVRGRLMKSVEGAAKVIGYVHNPDIDGETLLDATRSLLASIGEQVGKPAQKRSVAERWLVIANEGAPSDAATYRHVLSALSIPTDYKSILTVTDGRVEILAD